MVAGGLDCGDWRVGLWWLAGWIVVAGGLAGRRSRSSGPAGWREDAAGQAVQRVGYMLTCAVSSHVHTRSAHASAAVRVAYWARARRHPVFSCRYPATSDSYPSRCVGRRRHIAQQGSSVSQRSLFITGRVSVFKRFPKCV